MATHSSTAWRTPWQRSVVGYSPQGRRESDVTEWLHTKGKGCEGEEEKFRAGGKKSRWEASLNPTLQPGSSTLSIHPGKSTWAQILPAAVFTAAEAGSTQTGRSLVGAEAGGLGSHCSRVWRLTGGRRELETKQKGVCTKLWRCQRTELFTLNGLVKSWDGHTNF